MQDAIGTGSLDQAEMLGRLISRVATLEAAVADSHNVRRDLHNQLVNLRGNVSPLTPQTQHFELQTQHSRPQTHLLEPQAQHYELSLPIPEPCVRYKELCTMHATRSVVNL